MDLFEQNQQNSQLQPLAEMIRPKSLSGFLGQDRVVGKNSTLGRLIQAGHIPSLILWGPPGCGKTTFARLLSNEVSAEFKMINAVEVGVRTLRELGESSRRQLIERQLKTIVFVDEIHRFNKSQQDVLLPYVEKGDFILIGATTENPSYQLNSALLSRCQLVVFDQLDRASLEILVQRGVERFQLKSTDLLVDETLSRLIQAADGDGRRLLNMVEQIAELYKNSKESQHWPLKPEDLSSVLSACPLYYDRQADEHYDCISAFIKSIRGSDADAGLYYLARMLLGGEDPKFIARRLVILASEDIGNADPKALSIAVAGAQAVDIVGLPEAAINLAQVVSYLSTTPKSNRSYLGLRKAEAEIKETGRLPVPKSLRSAKTPAMKKLGYGKNYEYSHDSDKGWVNQRFLPEGVVSENFYQPVERGYEKHILEYMKWLKANN